MDYLIALSDSKRTLQSYQKRIGGYLCSDNLLVIIMENATIEDINNNIVKYLRKSTKAVIISEDEDVYANCSRRDVERMIDKVIECIDRMHRIYYR
jgi:hypothetical protein